MKNRIPLRAALRSAQKRFGKHPDVLAVGIGFKYSSRHGYTRTAKEEAWPVRGVPCIKLLVRKKIKESRLKKSAKRRCFPKYIVVRTRTRQVRVLTDVEDCVGLDQNTPPIATPVNLNAYGTPSLVVRGATENGHRWAVTAGHVFRNRPADDSVTLPQSRAMVSGVDVGHVEWHTWRRQNTGGLVDAAAVRLSGNETIPSQLNTPPLVGSLVGMWSYLETLQAKQEGGFYYFAADGAKNGHVVAVLDVVFPSSVTLDLASLGPIKYSPMIVGLRVYSGQIGPGDSGAAWYDAAGRILGIHIVGKTKPNYSYSQSAEIIFSELSAGLGTQLQFV